MSTNLSLPKISIFDNFERDYFFLQKPVVIAGGASFMTAFTRWTDTYLLETLGNLKPLVMLADGRRARMRFADYFSYLVNPDAYQSTAGLVYMTDLFLKPAFLGPELAALALDAMCPLPRSGEFAERVAMFAGPKGTASEMHQDVFSPHVWVAQLRGEKAWRLCNPVDLDVTSAARVDAFNDTENINVAVYETLLEPGDLLYLPPDWWHQVRNESSSLAIFGHFWAYPDARRWYADTLTITDEVFRHEWQALWESMLILP
jgi:Cupin-like domain